MACASGTTSASWPSNEPPPPRIHPADSTMSNPRSTILRTFTACALAAASLGMAGIAAAQTKLTCAHVYEISEPFHKFSVWAGDEIKRRTNGRSEVQVFPASTHGKEADTNQGLTLGTVDIIMAGPSFAGRLYPPLAVSAFPFIFRDAEHQIKYARSDVFKEL